MRVFCEQLTLCPTQLFPGGVLERYTDCSSESPTISLERLCWSCWWTTSACPEMSVCSCPGSCLGSTTMVGDFRKTRVSLEKCFVWSDVLWIKLVACSISQGAEKEEQQLHGQSGALVLVSPNGDLYRAFTFWQCVQVYLQEFSLGSAFTVLNQRNSLFQMMVWCHFHNFVHHLTAYCSLQL